MDIRVLSPAYAVSPQIDPEDASAIVEAGYKTVLCNRPDMEIPPSHHADAMRTAMEAAGLAFVDNPFIHGQLNEATVALQSKTIAEQGPVLAYCASGTRCTVLWMLSQAMEGVAVDTLLEAAGKAGYQLEGMRPQLEALASRSA